MRMEPEPERLPLVCYSLQGATQLCRSSTDGVELSTDAVRHNTNALRVVLEHLPADAARGMITVIGQEMDQHLVEMRLAGRSTATIQVDGLRGTSTVRVLLGRLRGMPSLRWVVLDATALGAAAARPYPVPKVLFTGRTVQLVVGAADEPDAEEVGDFLMKLAGAAKDRMRGVGPRTPRTGRGRDGERRVGFAVAGVPLRVYGRHLGPHLVIHGGEHRSE